MFDDFGLDIDMNEVSVSLSDYSLRIIGESGTGKSTMMKHLLDIMAEENGGKPVGVYVPLEGGYTHLKGLPVLKPTDKRTGIKKDFCANYSDVKQVIDMIVNAKKKNPNNGMKFVIIDTATRLEYLLMEEVENRHYMEKGQKADFNATFGGFGRGHKILRNILASEIIAKLRNVGVIPWWVSHSRVKGQKDKISAEEYTIVGSDSGEGYDNIILQDVDLSLAFAKDRVISNGKVIGEKRTIRFRPDTVYQSCKSRFLNVPTYIDITENPRQNAESIVRTIKEAIMSDGEISSEQELEAISKQQKEQKEIDNVIKVETAKLEDEDNKLSELKKSIKDHVENQSKLDPLNWSTWLESFGGIELFKRTVDEANSEYLNDLVKVLGM